MHSFEWPLFQQQCRTTNTRMLSYFLDDIHCIYRARERYFSSRFPRHPRFHATDSHYFLGDIRIDCGCTRDRFFFVRLFDKFDKVDMHIIQAFSFLHVACNKIICQAHRHHGTGQMPHGAEGNHIGAEWDAVAMRGMIFRESISARKAQRLPI